MNIAVRFRLPMSTDYIKSGESIYLASSGEGVDLLYLYRSGVSGRVYLKSDIPAAIELDITRLSTADEFTAYLITGDTTYSIGLYNYSEDVYLDSSSSAYTSTTFGRLKIAQDNIYPALIINVLSTYPVMTKEEIVAII